MRQRFNAGRVFQYLTVLCQDYSRGFNTAGMVGMSSETVGWKGAVRWRTVRRSGIHHVQNTMGRFITAGPENRCARDFLCVGAGIMGRNLRQQFDERRTAVIELGLSTRIGLCQTAWSSFGWRRKPLIAGLELICFGMPRDWLRNCRLRPL